MVDSALKDEPRWQEMLTLDLATALTHALEHYMDREGLNYNGLIGEMMIVVARMSKLPDEAKERDCIFAPLISRVVDRIQTQQWLSNPLMVALHLVTSLTIRSAKLL